MVARRGAEPWWHGTARPEQHGQKTGAASHARQAAIAAGNPPPVPGPLPPPAVGVPGQLPFDWLGQRYQWIDLSLGQRI